MLRCINPSEVELGMFIHGFEGSWLDHPFWRKKFLLVEEPDLQKIRTSKVKAVIVDQDRSMVVADGVSAEPDVLRLPTATPLPAALREVARRYSAPAAKPRKASFRQEIRQADKIVAKSRKRVGAMFESARLGQALRLREVMPLIDEIRDSVERNSRALTSLVRLKSKDEYTFMHSVAVCTLMVNFARQLEMDDATIRAMGVAGLLHDLGKMAVPQAILDKPDRLTDDEMITIRSHPVRGHALIGNNPEIPDIARDVCLHHHEKIDGSGYPFGLAGDEISLAARMGAICDVYDAVTSDRPYKKPWTPSTALARMSSWQGHFDERLMQIFITSLGQYPSGALVRLDDSRLAVVIDNCADDPEAMRLTAFYCTASLEETEPRDIVVMPDRGVQIVGVERPDFWRLEGWDDRRLTLLANAAIVRAAA